MDPPKLFLPFFAPFNYNIQYSIIMIVWTTSANTTRTFFTRLLNQYSVRVRYAPSPTGFMHIGGLRTALFNYLFARKHKGQFIVRIEDTDRAREVQGSIDNIFESLEWIGVTPDESIKKEGEFGPYIQSQRLPIYKAIQKQLLKSNMAYPCFCHQQEQKKDPQQPEAHMYDGKCRSLTFQQIKKRITAKEQYAVRIKSDLIPWPKTFNDEVFGELQFKPLDDFVIVRSNGWPTFHFANVIDDWKMDITHVMRGQEWLTNTNKHVYLYNLFGVTPPKFVHLPLIKAMNGKKLAKRDPTSAVRFFQDGKYEVQAVKCFLAQMGLNRATNQSEEKQKIDKPETQKTQKKQQKDSKKTQTRPKKEQQNLKLTTDAQMIQQFDLSKITKVPVKFDVKQLDFLNRLSLKKRWKSAQSFQSEMQYFIQKTHQFIPSSKGYSNQYIKKFIACVVQRFTHITDIALYKYYFQEPNYFDQAAKEDLKKIYGRDTILLPLQSEKQSFKFLHYDPISLQKNKKIIHHLRLLFEHVIEPENYCQLEILKKISEFLFQSPELKNQEVYHLLRFAVSGRKSGPNITAACALIGKEKILKRLELFSGL